MRLGLHLCRGNFRGRWMATGGYEPVADRLFNGVPVDVFLLEYDSERAGDFTPLRFVPRASRWVLGLLSSKLERLEDEADLVRRIEAAGRVPAPGAAGALRRSVGLPALAAAMNCPRQRNGPSSNGLREPPHEFGAAAEKLFLILW
jgi:hypothetical protein